MIISDNELLLLLFFHMLMLSFDTTDYTSIALSRDGKTIASENIYQKCASEQLITLINRVLTINKIDISNIDYLSLTKGPGSFTGIRIALSVAKGILVAIPKIKAAVFSNFEVLNYHILRNIKYCDYSVTAIKAINEKVYLQCFNQSNPTGKAEILDINQAIDRILNLNGITVCGGDGIYGMQNRLKLSKNITILPLSSYVQAETLSKLAYKQISNNRYSDEIVPLYI